MPKVPYPYQMANWSPICSLKNIPFCEVSLYNLSVHLNQIILTTKKILEGSHGSTQQLLAAYPLFLLPLVGRYLPKSQKNRNVLLEWSLYKITKATLSCNMAFWSFRFEQDKMILKMVSSTMWCVNESCKVSKVMSFHSPNLSGTVLDNLKPVSVFE